MNTIIKGHILSLLSSFLAAAKAVSEAPCSDGHKKAVKGYNLWLRNVECAVADTHYFFSELNVCPTKEMQLSRIVLLIHTPS